MTSQFADMTSSSNSFDVPVFFSSSLVTGPSFHVNIITGSEVVTIFVYKGLTRNLEIGNASV